MNLGPRKENPLQTQYRNMQSQKSAGTMEPVQQTSASVNPLESLGPKYVRPMPAIQGPPKQPAFSRQSPAWQNQYEQTFNQAMQADRQRQIDAANKTVDDKLAARQGFYPTPQQRQSGFFQRGMGPMAGDAAIMARQNQPLGDGGPAAAAARADQQRRRAEAEQIMASSGATPDGLTRYRPNQDLLDFVNSSRSAGDQINVMTPSEIQFNRHKMNMANNPAYAARVNQQRADRQEMLDNRREMVRARRAGALEAAGASQQMRNLQAGRGSLAGQDGFNALMGLAAMQNPNQAFGDYGPAFQANAMPGMLEQRLDAEGNMLDRRAQLERLAQFDTIRSQIVSSGMPDMEKQRALRSLNDLMMNSGALGPTPGGAVPGVQGGGGYVPPSGVPLPDRSGADPNEPTAAAYARYMIGLKASPQWNSMTREQQDEFLANIRSQYFPGMTESDFAQYREDNETDILSNIGNAIMGIFGRNPAAIQRKEERRNALEPPTKLPADSPWNQGGPTDDDRRVLGAMGFR